MIALHVGNTLPPNFYRIQRSQFVILSLTILRSHTDPLSTLKPMLKLHLKRQRMAISSIRKSKHVNRLIRIWRNPKAPEYISGIDQNTSIGDMLSWTDTASETKVEILQVISDSTLFC